MNDPWNRARLAVKQLVCGAAIVLTAVSLVGCFYAYRTVLENHSDGPVQFDFLGRDKKIDPCTVYYYGEHNGPGLGQRFVVSVKDLQGDNLWSDTIKETKEDVTPDNYVLFVLRYPLEGSLNCPDPVQDQYILKLENGTGESQLIVYAGQQYRVEGESTMTIGPLEGSATDLIIPTVPDETGQDRITGGDLGWDWDVPPYRIGEMPVKRVMISQPSGFY